MLFFCISLNKGNLASCHFNISNKGLLPSSISKKHTFSRHFSCEWKEAYLTSEIVTLFLCLRNTLKTFTCLGKGKL